MKPLIEFENEIFSIIKREGLNDLHYFPIEEAENVPSFFVTEVRKKESLRRPFFEDFKFHDDLYFISRDLAFVTGVLFYLQPHINDPVKEKGTYFKSSPDARYMMYINFAHQLVYNYWDRIGDLLNEFFETGLPDKRVYVSRVLNNFPVQFKANKNYLWLKNTFEENVKPLIDSRDEIVHSIQIETKVFYAIMDNYKNQSKHLEMQSLKNSFPLLFKKHLALCCESFIMATKLIAECAKDKNYSTVSS